MSDNKKMNPIVEVKQEAPQGPTEGGPTLNLDDVAYMITIGRYKNGKEFFIPVNVTDLFTIRGMIDFAQEEIHNTYRGYFAMRKEDKSE